MNIFKELKKIKIPKIDQKFRDEYIENKYKTSIINIRIALIFFIFIYSVFIFADKQVADQNFQFVLYFKLFIALPLAFLYLYLSYKKFIVKYYHIYSSILTVTLIFTLLIIISLSTKQQIINNEFYVALIIMMICSVFLFKIDFYPTIIINLAIIIAYVYIMVDIQSLHICNITRFYERNLYLFSTFILNILGSHFFERINKQELINKNRILDYNKKLIILNHEAQKATKIKNQFISNMSHEIRTPLNSVIGFAQLMTYSDELSKAKTYSDKINFNAMNLMKIINNVLFLSNLESEKYLTHVEKVNLKLIIEATISKYKVKNSHLKVNFEIKDLKKEIFSDGYRVSQLIDKLISNAFKFTKEGKVEVIVEKFDERCFVINIIDTGIGIKEDQINMIFNPFTQVDSNVSKEYYGSGLGLAISNALAKLLNGKIEVESEISKGSTFKVILPFNYQN